jgi:hypothetical protein
MPPLMNYIAIPADVTLGENAFSADFISYYNSQGKKGGVYTFHLFTAPGRKSRGLSLPNLGAWNYSAGP